MRKQLSYTYMMLNPEVVEIRWGITYPNFVLLMSYLLCL